VFPSEFSLSPLAEPALEPLERREPMKRVCLWAGVVLAAAAGARAETTACTEITSASLTISAPGLYCLKSSLVVEDGIRIFSDDVTVDLNDHMLEAKPSDNPGDGVFAYNRHNVVVRNGTLRGFRFGVLFDGDWPYTVPQAHVLENLNVEGCRWAGLFVVGQGTVVRNNHVMHTGGPKSPFQSAVGIWVSGLGSRVSGNTVVDTIEPSGASAYGILIQGSTAAVAEGNVVSNAAFGPTSSVGIAFGGSERSTAIGNRIVNMRRGISMGAAGVYMDNTVGGATTPFNGGMAAGATNFSF
jgi:hypothetical protein